MTLVAMIGEPREKLLDGTLDDSGWEGLGKTLTKLGHHRARDLSGAASPH